MIILCVIAYICTYIIQKMICKLLTDARQLNKNFRGDEIPGAMGIAIIISVIITSTFAVLYNKVRFYNTLFYVFACSMMGFAGIIDDFIGTNSSKGFKGHMRQLMKGGLTTGSLKMLIGGIISLIIAFNVSKSVIEVIINTFLISFTTNLINLLDTRPGRAIKGFMLVSIFILSTGGTTTMLVIVLGALAAYLPIDLEARGMLGDAGANFIGMVLGTSIVLSASSIAVRLLILILVAALNIASERYSFNEVIAKNNILRFIDELGRK